MYYLDGICDDEDSGLLESVLLDVGLIGKCTGNPSAGTGGRGSSVVGEFDDCSLSIGPGRNDDNVGCILNGCDSSGGEFNFLPGFLDVDDLGTIFTSVGEVPSHVEVKVLSTNVSLFFIL